LRCLPRSAPSDAPFFTTPTPSRQTRSSRRSALNLLQAAAALLVVSLGLSGCATWRGARLYQSGTHALERGDTASALRDLSAAVELVPHASEIHNHLGLAQLQAGEPVRALRSFERAVELDCDNRAARENLARAEARLARDAAGGVARGESARGEAP
jgi:Flp pilus assembly protein TadD